MRKYSESPTTVPEHLTDFASDVQKGLSHLPKFLSSRYFYDEAGSKLFQQIMHLEEYYPTRTEFAILDKHKSVLREIFEEDGLPVDLIEFGAGDGLKTRLLLEEMLNEGTDFRYTPIDISEDALEWLSQSLLTDFPSLEIKTMHDDYFRALDKLHDETGWREVVLFLGSNLGNFDLEGSLTFLGEIRARLNPGDYLFIGLDLKKDPNRILKAYNDAQGVTREFNMNLLRRMNRELNANFNLDKFLHYPTYEPITGEMKSYLISAEEQEVYFELMDFTVQFGAWECIHTETSWKYELGEIEQMAAATGYEIRRHFRDENGDFVDSLWRAV